MDISIVIPAYNEEKGLPETLDAIKNVVDGLRKDYEIIVIDDGLTDATSLVAKEKDVIVIGHPYNLGYGAALKTGIKHAKGEFIIMLDADGSYPAREIPNLLEYSDNFDVVVGARKTLSGSMPLLRRIGNRIFSFLASYICERKVRDPASGFRVFHKNVINLRRLPDGFSFSTTMTVDCIKTGLRVVEIPVDYEKRVGRSKLHTLRDGMKFLKILFRLMLDYDPMKFFFPISASLLFLGSVYGLYTLVVYQNITDACLLLVITGVELFCFGMLADMITRRLA